MNRRLLAAVALLACLAVVASVAAESYRTAKVKQLGLRFQVPASWSSVSPKKPVVFAVRNDSEGGTFRSNINVVVVPLKHTLTLAEYRKALQAELTGAKLKHVVVKIRHLPAGDAVRTSYSAEVGGITVQGAQACFLRGLKSVVVTYSRDRKKAKVAAVFTHSINSIRFS